MSVVWGNIAQNEERGLDVVEESNIDSTLAFVCDVLKGHSVKNSLCISRLSF